MDVTDLQRTTFDPNVGLAVANYSESKVKGVELELVVAPTTGVTVGGNIGYVTAKTLPIDVDLQPKTTLALYAQYDAPEFDNGMYLSLRVDGDYRSKHHGTAGMSTPAERTVNPAFPLPPAVYAGFSNAQAYLDDQIKRNMAGGYALVNARVSLMDLPLGTAKARLTGFVRNAFDHQGVNYSVIRTFIQTSYERPRTYGVEFGISF